MIILTVCRLFKDELTLGNVARPQLVSMCQYMGLPQYGKCVHTCMRVRVLQCEMCVVCLCECLHVCVKYVV